MKKMQFYASLYSFFEILSQIQFLTDLLEILHKIHSNSEKCACKISGKNIDSKRLKRSQVNFVALAVQNFAAHYIDVFELIPQIQFSTDLLDFWYTKT